MKKAKTKDRFSSFDGQDVHHIGLDGEAGSVNDVWFEQELRDWEHQGVDARVVYLARPLLEGNTAQQREAHQLLGRIRDNWMRPGEAMSEVAGLLGRQGLPLGSMPKATDEELNEAWDGMSGSAGSRPTGDVSFGKSEKSERDAQTGGWVASPRD